MSGSSSRDSRPAGASRKLDLRPWIAGGAAVVVLTAGVLWQIGPPASPETAPAVAAPDDETHAPEPAPVAAPAPAEAETDAPPETPEPEPGTAPPGERPSDLVDESYQRTRRGMRLQPKKAIALYEHFQEHPEDGRAQLALAFDAINRAWWEQSIEHYLKAYRADPRLKHEPRMLEDLVNVAAMDVYHEQAAAALIEIYGRDALESVDARLDRARAEGRRRSARLLSDLREELAR